MGSPKSRYLIFNELSELVGGESSPSIQNDIAASPPEQVLIRQWAAAAKASSQYDDPDWAAHQATGAPNTPDCGDHETAWASAEKFSVEWLEVGYETTVYPTEINIYESHTPTQIVKVEILDDTGNYHEVYLGAPEATSCPYVLNIPVENASYKAAAVKITIDQTVLNLPWDEIDAVELIGYSDAVPAQPSELASEGPSNPPPPSTGNSDNAARNWTNFTSADGLPDDNVQALAAATDGTLWIGMKEGGVSSFKNGKFTNFSV